MPLLRLIRYPNLLIIILTMVLMRYGIIQPILATYGLSLVFPDVDFLMLVTSVVFIAASGYLINDYYDLPIDLVNRPEKVIIGTYIAKENAYKLYMGMNLCALLLSCYISVCIHTLVLFIIFPLTIGLLWFYSTTYKRQFLVGTFLVSLITALVPMLVAFYEIPPVIQSNHEYISTYQLKFTVIFSWIGAFSVFAFLISMVREFVKDAEDFEGDRIYGRKTLPVVLGIPGSKLISIGFIAMIVIGLSVIYYKYLRLVYVYDKSTAEPTQTSFDYITFLYFMCLIFIPLFLVMYLISTASGKKQYAMASLILKLVMVAGCLFAIVVRIKISS